MALLVALPIIEPTTHVATALTLAPRSSAGVSVVFGIEASSGDVWTNQVQAQLETWAASVPKEHIVIVGGAYGRTSCMEQDSACKEAVLLFRARRRMRELKADWLLALHEDSYVVVEHLSKLMEADPHIPQIASSIGCGQGWEYHVESKNGTMPKPEGYVEPEYVCDSVWKRGALCSAAGMFVSIAALDALTYGLTEDEFIKAHRNSLAPHLRDDLATQCDMPTSCLAHERGVRLVDMYDFGLGMGQPSDYTEFNKGVTDEHMREWLVSDRLYGDWPPSLIHSNIPKQLIPSFMHSLHRVRASSPRGSRVTPRRLENSISLALIVDPAGATPAGYLLKNYLEQLSKGPTPVTFYQVLLFYDGRPKNEGRMGAFLADVEELKGEGILQRAVRIRHDDPEIQRKCGIQDPDGHDGSLFATYQYLVEECESEYCVYFNSDIFLHQGGGIRHAISLLQQHADLVFALPPLASESVKKDPQLQAKYMNADYEYPYPNPIGRLPADAQNRFTQNCTRGIPTLSTRYYVAQPDRFRQLLPLRLVSNHLLEQHEDLGRHSATTLCPPGEGWVVHPPPWGLGALLFGACDYKALQKAVDNSESLAVDCYNNMVMESWKDACARYM